MQNKPLSTSIFVATIASDALLIAVTAQSKHLRSVCNALIAFSALLSIIRNVWIIAEYFVIPPIWGEITVANCFWATWMYFVTTETLTLMPAVLALERLLGVLFPVWSVHCSFKQRFLLLTLPALGYGFTVTVYFGTQLLATPNELVLCNVGLVYGAPFGLWVPLKSYIVIGASWAMYAAMWATFKFRRNNRQDDESFVATFRRLNRGLTVIVVLDTFGCLTPPVTVTVLLWLQVSQQTYFMIYSMAALYSTNIALALVLPALFFISTEYRKATKEFFVRCLFFINRNNNRQSPAQTTAVQTNQIHPMVPPLYSRTQQNNSQPQQQQQLTQQQPLHLMRATGLIWTVSNAAPIYRLQNTNIRI